jgi:hypothetical protein
MPGRDDGISGTAVGHLWGRAAGWDRSRSPGGTAVLCPAKRPGWNEPNGESGRPLLQDSRTRVRGGQEARAAAQDGAAGARHHSGTCASRPEPGPERTGLVECLSPSSARRMASFRSRRAAALGTLLLGVLLVGGPLLKAFGGTCPRRAGDAAAETIVEDGAFSASPHDRSARLQGTCTEAGGSHIAAVPVDSPRWGTAADTGTSRVETPLPPKGPRPPVATRPTTGPPASPDSWLRSVVLQV